MEDCMKRVKNAIGQLSKALDTYTVISDDIEKLACYYQGEEWKQDFLDDEKGKFPNELKRGVLSEDGLWNLLSEAKELNRRLSEVAKMNAERYEKTF